MEVRIEHISADGAMSIVRELRQKGWVQGVDFDFSYSPATYNNDGWSQTSPRQVKFKFYKEQYATFFALKYLNR